MLGRDAPPDVPGGQREAEWPCAAGENTAETAHRRILSSVILLGTRYNPPPTTAPTLPEEAYAG